MIERPDALEQERDFLLSSLDDLEAEYCAGDLSEADYQALTSDYTNRAAVIIRSLEAETAPPEQPEPARSWKRTVAWSVGIVLLASIAGSLVAEFSGSRSLGDSISGDIRTTSRELLVEAQIEFGSGDLDGAIEIYDEVLDIQPSNTEALAYKGWLLRLSGDLESAVVLMEDAVAIDPEYPDARVFAAVLALDRGDINMALAHLNAFDALDASPVIARLVEQQGLRRRIDLLANDDILSRVESVLMVADPPPFTSTGITIDEVLLAAETLAAGGRVVDALQLVQQVDSEVPGDPDLLAGYGWLLARSASVERPEPAGLARARLDAALAVDPAHPEALVYRSFVLAFLGESALAAVDLAAFEALDTQPPALVNLIEGFDLRGQIG